MRKLLLVAALLAASAAHAQGVIEMKATGVPGKAAATRRAEATATVKSVDVAARTVTLSGAGGATHTFKVGPEVKRLEDVKPGDVVDIAVEQDLILEYQSAGTPSVEPTAIVVGDRAGKDQGPGAVVAAGVQATVVVTAIDQQNRMVVFQGPGGNLYQVRAGPDVKLERLKVGDRLLATYVEAAAVRLEKSAPKGAK